jgi:lipid II:glycine glycyltransferase (peptidoglycan interpeptide bridge formation enzyme)
MTLSKNKEQWNGWIVSETNHNQFPQSFEWGEILRAEGREVERYVFEFEGKIVAQIQLIHHRLLNGWTYSFAPKGPVLAKNYTGGIITNFKEFFRLNKLIFARVEPTYDLVRVNFPVAPVADVNPRATVLLDLNKTKEALLAEMHAKTRYNIHLAQKKNLRIAEVKDIKILMELMRQTGKRDGFHLHPNKHYAKILESNISRQLVAYDSDRPVATAVFVGFGDTFTYLFGASDYASRQLMAPYLLQWEGIKMGKAGGYKYYDFFGIAPGARDQGGDYVYDPKHKYAGITRFKMGFGGDIAISPGTVDIIIEKKMYWLYRILRRLRRMI